MTSIAKILLSEFLIRKSPGGQNTSIVRELVKFKSIFMFNLRGLVQLMILIDLNADILIDNTVRMRENTCFASKFCAHAGATCELAPQQEPHLGYKKPASRGSVPKEHRSDRSFDALC